MKVIINTNVPNANVERYGVIFTNGTSGEVDLKQDLIDWFVEHNYKVEFKEKKSTKVETPAIVEDNKVETPAIVEDNKIFEDEDKVEPIIEDKKENTIVETKSKSKNKNNDKK